MLVILLQIKVDIGVGVARTVLAIGDKGWYTLKMLRKDPFITGEYYHIYNRGIDKRTIFKLERDYERFMMLLYISNSNKARKDSPCER